MNISNEKVDYDDYISKMLKMQSGQMFSSINPLCNFEQRMTFDEVVEVLQSDKPKTNIKIILPSIKHLLSDPLSYEDDFLYMHERSILRLGKRKTITALFGPSSYSYHSERFSSNMFCENDSVFNKYRDYDIFITVYSWCIDCPTIAFIAERNEERIDLCFITKFYSKVVEFYNLGC
jgi:hypothetical protein